MSDTLSTSGEQNSPGKGAKRLQEGGTGGSKNRLDPAFEIKFEGNAVSPDRILMPDLANVIRAVQRLTAGNLPEDSAPLPDEEKLRLLSVRRGSALYALAGPSRTVAGAHLRLLGAVIERPEQIGENDYLLHPVRTLSQTAAKLECTISIREPGRGGDILARIGPKTYSDLSKSILITGQTEFGGKVERVGGATRSKCGLRVAFQKRMLICRVPKSSVARMLGEHLYKRVVVSGEAAWIRTTWRVFSFRVESVRPLKDVSIFDKIQAIREAGGSDWDRVANVREYLDLDEPSVEPTGYPLGQQGRATELDHDSEAVETEGEKAQ